MEPDAWDHAHDAAPNIDDDPGPDNGLLPKIVAHSHSQASGSRPASVAKCHGMCSLHAACLCKRQMLEMILDDMVVGTITSHGQWQPGL